MFAFGYTPHFAEIYKDALAAQLPFFFYSLIRRHCSPIIHLMIYFRS